MMTHSPIKTPIGSRKSCRPKKVLSCRSNHQILVYDSGIRNRLSTEETAYETWIKSRGLEEMPEVSKIEFTRKPDTRKIVEFVHAVSQKRVGGKTVIVFYDRRYKEWEKRIRAKAMLKLNGITLEKNPLAYALCKFQVYSNSKIRWK